MKEFIEPNFALTFHENQIENTAATHKVLYSAVWEYARRCGEAVRSGDRERIRVAREEQEAYLALCRACNYDFADQLRVPDSSEYQ